MTVRLRAADLKTGNWKADIPYNGSVDFDLELNGAGAFKAQVPLRAVRRYQASKPYHQSVIARAPALYYRFGEVSGTSAVDASGNGRTGTITGTAGTDYALGQPSLLASATDRSLQFIASGYVTTAHNAALTPTDTWTMTFLTDPSSAGTVRTIFNKGTGATASHLMVWMDASDRIVMGRSDGTIDGRTSASYTGLHHVVIRKTAAGAGGYTVTVDGAAVGLGTNAPAAVAGANTAAVYIGSKNAGASPYLRGYLDEFAWFPTVALSDADVAILADAAVNGNLETHTSSIAITTRENLDPGKTVMVLERDGDPVESWVLWGAVPDTENGTLDLSGSNGLSLLDHRLIRRNFVYGPGSFIGSTDQAQITKDLIDYTNGRSDTRIGTGSISMTGILRDRQYYSYEDRYIGETISALSAVEHGFDFAVLTSYDPITGEFVWTFRVYYPQRGALTGRWWTFTAPGGRGATLKNMKGPTNAMGVVNSAVAVGAGEGDSMLHQTKTDTGALSRGWVLMEDRFAYKTVIDNGTLAAHAQHDLELYVDPWQTYTGTLREDNPDTQYGSWTLGDVVRITGEDGWLTLPAPDGNDIFRITKASIKMSNDKTEQVLSFEPPVEN